MSKQNIVEMLRENLGRTAMVEKEAWVAPSLPSGVAKGVVAELLGNAKVEWLMSLFSGHPDEFIFWCELSGTTNPVAIHQRGVGLERIKFVRGTQDLQQPLRLALESGLYPFIVAPNLFKEVRIFQRFSLLAEKSQSTLFLLGEDQFSSAWPISLQIDINRRGEDIEIEVVKQKFGSSK